MSIPICFVVILVNQDGPVLRSWASRGLTEGAEPSEVLGALRSLQNQRGV